MQLKQIYTERGFFLTVKRRTSHTFTDRKGQAVMNREGMFPGATDDFQNRLLAKDALYQAQEVVDPTLQSAQSKLDDARATLTREQERLDMTPHLRGNKGNLDYGA